MFLELTNLKKHYIGPDGLGPLKGTFEALGMVECLGGSSARSISARDGVFEADLDL